MNEWISFFVGVALALTGIGLTIFLRPGRRANVYIASRWYIKKDVTSDTPITVRFSGNEVQGVRFHRIFFWNSGNMAIRSTDIPEDKRLSVKFASGSRLSVIGSRTVGQTFRLKPDVTNSTLGIDLDHLDKNQGFYIDLYEAIPDFSGYVDPYFDGHLLDSKGVISNVVPEHYREVISDNAAPLLLGFLLLIFCIFLIVFADALRIISDEDAYPANVLVAFGVLVFLWCAQPLTKLTKSLRYRVPQFRRQRSDA